MKPTTSRLLMLPVLCWALFPGVLAACGSLDIQRQEINETSRLWYTKTEPEPSYPVSDTLRCDDDITGTNQFAEHFPAGGATCDADQCFLPGAHAIYVRLNRTLNVTLSDQIEDYIFNEVANQVHEELKETEPIDEVWAAPAGGSSLSRAENPHWIDFNRTSVWPMQAGGGYQYQCLDRGEAGHFSMRPIWICVDATVRECDESDEDIAVQACGLPVQWGDPRFERAHVLTLWNLTEVDPSSMDEQLIRVANATIEDGEEPRSSPVWGGGASLSSRPQLLTFAVLVMLVTFMVY